MNRGDRLRKLGFTPSWEAIPEVVSFRLMPDTAATEIQLWKEGESGRKKDSRLHERARH